MNSRFLSIAAIELEDAVFYYDNISSGLGSEFLEEIYSTIERISQFPIAWSKVSKRCHRCILNRFPYAVIYNYNKGEILVVAITHLNKRPKNWENRLVNKN